MKFGADIHGTQMMNHTVVSYPLTLNLMPTKEHTSGFNLI